VIERLAQAIAARRRTAVRLPQSLGGAVVAGRIADRLAADGFRIIEVVGLPELRGLPLAALGPVLGAASENSAEPIADRVHRLYMATASAKLQTVLVVDGAEHLDETSAAVIHQLVRTSGVRALLAVDGPLPGALERLAEHDQLLVELEDLLTAEECDALRFEAVLRPQARATSETFAWAAGRALSGGDVAPAAQLAGRALDRAAALGEPRPVGALVTLADALSLGGQLDAAEDAYAELLAVACGSALVATVDNAAMHWAIRRHDPDRAASTLRPVLDRVTDPALRTALETSLAEILFMAGSDGVPATEGAESDDPIAIMRRLIFSVHQGMYAGNLSAARATAQRARAFAAEHPSPGRPAGETVEFLWYLMLVVDARLGDATAHAHAFRAEHPRRFNGMWDYALALPRFLAGDLSGAMRAAQRAAARLAERDVVNAVGPSIALYATAAAAAGKIGVARSALAELPPNGRLGNVHTDLHAAEADAWVLVATGNTELAAHAIATAVRRGIDTNHTTFAALTAATAVRFGRPDAVLALLEEAARLAPEAALVPLLARYAAAAAAGDGVVLLDVARALAAAGLLGMAGDAATAAAAYDVPGAAALSSGYRVGNPTPDARSAAGLSRQEWAVVVAAAERLRNREIAERLGLSVRTVENYLANAFRKLGITRRDHLAERLRL
jgi:DNA-binding CsgD family transcriptional regulator